MNNVIIDIRAIETIGITSYIMSDRVKWWTYYMNMLLGQLWLVNLVMTFWAFTVLLSSIVEAPFLRFFTRCVTWCTPASSKLDRTVTMLAKAPSPAWRIVSAPVHWSMNIDCMNHVYKLKQISHLKMNFVLLGCIIPYGLLRCLKLILHISSYVSLTPHHCIRSLIIIKTFRKKIWTHLLIVWECLRPYFFCISHAVLTFASGLGLDRKDIGILVLLVLFLFALARVSDCSEIK